LPALAESIDVTRSRVAEVDHGKAGTSRAAYFGALWVLGLLDSLYHRAGAGSGGEGLGAGLLPPLTSFKVRRELLSTLRHDPSQNPWAVVMRCGNQDLH
jgi:hypothetical protein